MLDADVDPKRDSPATLLSAWTDQLGPLIDRAAAPDELTLDDAANVLAAYHPHFDQQAYAAELRDRLRIAMINGVMDVVELADATEIDRSPPDWKRRIRGEDAMTLEEYAHARCATARREAH